MSRDYLAGRIEKMHMLNGHLAVHNKTYADRVEKVVCEVFGVTHTALRIRSRIRVLCHARFVLFSILYQPGKSYNRRSQGWLARRYNIDPWAVQHGLERVRTDTELQRKEITVMALLERQLELELFGRPLGEKEMGQPIQEPPHSKCEPILL